MQVNGNAYIFLQLFHQGVGVIGQQKVCHVLDADGVRAHFFQLHAELYKVILVVNGALSVADGNLRHAAVFLDVLYSGLHVPGIVQGVENTNDINAVFDGLFAEGFHHVVGIMAVAQKVLSPKQHLQLGVGQTLFQGAQTLPGIFIQKAHAHVEGGASPAFQGPVADTVQKGQNGHHVLQFHAGSRLGLMGVAQNGICNF